MLVFVNKIENLNNQETVKSSYFTSIGGILLNYFSGILFKYYLQFLNKMIENKHIEFKQKVTPELEKEVVAFLNSNEGGIILA